jgi:NADPH-dependent F420 reductase
MHTIAVLGTGDVGEKLAGAFARAGHKVIVGTRDPNSDKIKKVLTQLGHANQITAATFENAAFTAQIVVIAVNGSVVEQVVKSIAPHVGQKIVIDVTNPLHSSKEHGLTLSLSNTTSGGEAVQKWLPNAHVVKTLNWINWRMMENPKEFLGEEPTAFVAGNDAASKATVTQLLKDLHWTDIVDFGGIQGSRDLEAIALVWIHFAMSSQGVKHGLKLIRG